MGPIGVAEFLDVWRPRAHAAWEGITSQDIKVVPVPPGAWDLASATYDQVWGAVGAGSSGLPMVGHDRAGFLEVARRLLEPRVGQTTVTGLALGPLQVAMAPNTRRSRQAGTGRTRKSRSARRWSGPPLAGRASSERWRSLSVGDSPDDL